MKTPKLNIMETSSKPFQDRIEAGQRLGAALKRLHIQPDVVLGIPRGGVVVAQQVAQILGSQLDIVLTRKIGAPGNPELAIGAVGEEGHLYLNEGLAEMTGADDDYIQRAKEHELKTIAQRKELFRASRPKVPLAGKTVVITDDGIATGATVQAAVWSVHREKPAKVIVAMPVGARSALEKLAQDADWVISLSAPENFGALGQFYIHFDQVDDSQVEEILKGIY